MLARSANNFLGVLIDQLGKIKIGNQKATFLILWYYLTKIHLFSP